MPGSSRLWPPRRGSGTMRHSVREEETWNREQHKCRPPGDDAGRGPAEDEARGGAGRLASEDVGPDATSLPCWKVIAGQRGDRRAGGRRHGAERQTGEQQVPVATGEGAGQRGDAPQHDAGRQQRIRLTRSTSKPTGTTNTAPTSSATELSSPIFALPICNARSSWGATAATVAASAPLRASTAPNRAITRARAGPPTSSTTSPRSERPSQRMARRGARPTCAPACALRFSATARLYDHQIPLRSAQPASEHATNLES